MKKTSIAIKCLTHIGIILFLLLNLLPLIIPFSSSLRSPDNMRSALSLFNEISSESYIQAFMRMKYFTVFKNSVVLTGVAVFVVVIIAPMASYPMARLKSKGSQLLYIFFLSGLVVPMQMVIVPVLQMIKALHIPSSGYTPILLFITCSLPFSTFLYTGFIRTSVPEELEEAAYIDGAGMFIRFWKIVFPLLIPATVSVIITQAVWIWNDFFIPMIFISKKAQSTLPLAMLGFMGDRINPSQWNILFAACFLCALPLILAFGALQKYFMSGLTVGAVKG